MNDADELKILVIEDDALQRKALCDMLTSWGNNVQSCENLSDARGLLARNSFHLTLLDMCLPDGNGLDFLAEQNSLKTQNAGAIVLITAFSDIKTAVSAIKCGAYDYLPKPFEYEYVKKIVRNVGKNTNLSERVLSLSRMTIGNYDDVWQLDNMIGAESMKDIFERAQRIAGLSDTTALLIMGETGTGKGMMAKAVHRLSNRADKPFIEVNCSAIPGQLIESEIFGYEKGAFTDAKNKKQGLLEIADGGTVFLDEIGDMELNLQSKLLKVIEDKEFRRLGGSQLNSVDVRIIAASNRDLKAMVADGKFREDLYYRLSVIPITMPPLREHTRSILPLANHFLNRLGKETGRKFKCFTDQACQAMLNYSWPGNIRELRNAVERSLILATKDKIDASDLFLSDYSPSQPPVRRESGEASQTNDKAEPQIMSLAESEQRLINSVLQSVNGNKNMAADILKIHRTTLYKKIKEYGLE